MNRGSAPAVSDLHDPRLPAAAPTLGDVVRDLAILDGLPLAVLLDLRRQAGHLVVDIEAAVARVTALAGQARPAPGEQDRWLSPADAARVLGVKVRWLLEHADEIPGVRRLSRKVVRFSERGLRRHLGSKA